MKALDVPSPYNRELTLRTLDGVRTRLRAAVEFASGAREHSRGNGVHVTIAQFAEGVQWQLDRAEFLYNLVSGTQ